MALFQVSPLLWRSRFRSQYAASLSGTENPKAATVRLSPQSLPLPLRQHSHNITAMLSRMVKDHQRSKAQLRDENGTPTIHPTPRYHH